MSSAPNISIQLVSDLHLEIGCGQGSSYEGFKIVPRAETLALLGDIGAICDNRLFGFLRRQLLQFKRVFYVLGNHEFYRMNRDDAIAKVQTFASQMKDEHMRDSSIGEFMLLDRTRVDLTPSVTLLGATLWSQLNPVHLDFLRGALTDFKRIASLTPETFVALHMVDRAWLNQEVEHIRTHEPGRTIIIFTHHAPTLPDTADPKYADGPTQSAFATELAADKCWGSPVKVWAFGHTHWSCDFMREGVRVVSNQKGYFHGGHRFDPNFILELW